MDEIYIISKNTNNSFDDVGKLPTYKRRYYINKLVEEAEQIEHKMKSR